MTSRFVWLFLFILLDTSIDWTRSMNFHRILLPAGDTDMDRPARDRRNVDRNFDSLRMKDMDKVGLVNGSDTESVTVRSNMTAANGSDYVIMSPAEESADAPTHLKECNPCVLWKPPEEDSEDETYHPNLTIIPMGGIFMFLTGLTFSFISWCTEDLRQDDERFMKISVPLYLSPTGSPLVTPAKHHPALRGVHHHRRSSISVSHAKSIQKGRIGVDEDIASNIDETTSEENTVIYNDISTKPAPVAAAGKSMSKRMSQKMGLNRSPNRYLRRQSLNSSNTTLSSAFSSRSPSVRTRNISFQNSQECTSPSSLSYGNADSYLDITPLIRHSTSAETPFTQRKLAFHTHLLTPPLLHFQVSSMNTSTTSLAESIPSLTSKPSMCDSAITEQMCISEDNESCGSEGACSRDRLIRQSSHKSGMMFLSGSYYEDPLILQCSYMEVDETLGPNSEPAIFTCGSRSPSPESVPGDADTSAKQICAGEPSSVNCAQESVDDSHGEDVDTQMNLLEGSDLSDCNSETGLTENQEGEEEFPKGSESTSYCSSPGAYRGMDPSLYYKLSVESNASTGSLQSPESMQSDSNSVCSSEVGLLRRVNPSVTLRALNPKSHTPRRERVSLNGVTYFSQHGGRRIQNGKVMRMCRSWCLGDKASTVYGQFRRGQLEKECYM